MSFNGFARQVMTLERKAVVVHGSFKPAGAGAPTAVTGRGVASVVRSGAGLFLVTLRHIWNAVLNPSVSVRLTTAADIVPQIGVVDLTAKTLQIRTNTAAVPTDIAADAGNVIYFAFAFSNTSAPSL